MKVLVTGIVQEKGLAELYENFDVDYDHQKAFNREEVLQKLPEYDAVLLMAERADQEFIDRGKNLKIISVNGVGYDHVDISYAKEKGIVVSNCPEAVQAPTAELTIALMLDVCRRVSEYDRMIRKGNWYNVSEAQYMGFTLKDTTLGIVGMGRIGKRVAEIARAFGMNILYSNLSPISASDAEKLKAQHVELETLLKNSDVVSLHTPYVAETHHLIAKEQFEMMKDSSYLINAARGSLVDEEALVWALQNKVIAGAGLDVFENEPYPSEELLKMDNVVMTPHAGTGCVASRTELSAEASENIVSLLIRGISRNQVNA